MDALRNRHREAARGLQKLHLGGNAITDAGVAAVAELLADSAALVDIAERLLLQPLIFAAAARRSSAFSAKISSSVFCTSSNNASKSSCVWPVYGNSVHTTQRF